MNNLETEKNALKSGVKKILLKFKSNVDSDAINVVKEAGNRNVQVANYINDMVEKNHLPDLDDIFLAYGYGVIAFFRLLKNLRKITFCYTILAVFQIYWFSGFPTTPQEFWYADWTLGGGTGSSYINKVVIPLASNKLYIQCDKSFIQDWDTDTDFQLYTGLFPTQNILFPGDFEIFNMTNCAGVVGQKFRQTFRDNCVGKKVCDVSDLHTILEVNNDTAPECSKKTTMFFA